MKQIQTESMKGQKCPHKEIMEKEFFGRLLIRLLRKLNIWAHRKFAYPKNKKEGSNGTRKVNQVSS